MLAIAHSNAYTTQEPSYLDKTTLVLKWFRIALKQRIKSHVQIFSHLRHSHQTLTFDEYYNFDTITDGIAWSTELWNSVKILLI